jgi:hypothetical protein
VQGARRDPRRRRADVFFSHFTNETESTSGHRPYESLFRAGIADGSPRGAHSAGEGIVRYNPAIPYSPDELVFADDAVSMPHEVDEDVEDLRLDMHDGAVSIELTPIAIDLAVSEPEPHVPASTIIRSFSGKSQEFLQDTSRRVAALWRP